MDPWRICGRLPPRMGELHANNGAVGMREVNNSLQRRDLAVRPESLRRIRMSPQVHGDGKIGIALTASCGEIRPSGTTAVASIQIAATPRVANPCLIMREKCIAFFTS